MTKELLKQMKKNTKSHIKYVMGISMYLGYPIHEVCETEIKRQVHLRRDDTKEDTVDKLEQILANYKTNTVKMCGNTYSSGRYDYFDYLSFSHSITELREPMNDMTLESITQERMRAVLKHHLGLKVYEHLECKVMDLFKEGIISWEEVQLSHGRECSL